MAQLVYKLMFVHLYFCNVYNLDVIVTQGYPRRITVSVFHLSTFITNLGACLTHLANFVHTGCWKQQTFTFH